MFATIPPMVRMGLSWALVLVLTLGGCAAVADDMRRAETSYEEARYENARVWLVDLEHEAPSMDPSMRARYFYLRGMTEYRLGHRLEALHYLAVARELAGPRGRGLSPQWPQIMERTLQELTPRSMTHHPPPPAQEATSGGSAETAHAEASPNEPE